ncbi:hypothetical protein SAMN06264365_1556, partial [Actinoplanes regularis]
MPGSGRFGDGKITGRFLKYGNRVAPAWVPRPLRAP